MRIRPPSSMELEELRAIASLQFRGLGEMLISDNILVGVASTGKIRQILVNDKTLYMTLRAADHRFVLHLPAGRRLWEIAGLPMFRVMVDSRYAGFVLRGGNVFTKHVVFADPLIRPHDEVVVVDEDDSFIGVGRALHPGWLMNSLNRGEAVKVREAAGE